MPEEEMRNSDSEPGSERAVAFISYAREDGGFVRRLEEALRLQAMEVRGDWQLARGEGYFEQLRVFIRESDAFLFIISPESVRSESCRGELDLAVEMRKRIFPVLYRDHGEDSLLHAALRDPQWVLLREGDDFVAEIQKLVEAMNTDFDLLPMHRELLARADAWQKSGRKPSYLLRKEGLKRAEEWLGLTGLHPTKLPRPTALQSEYLLASRRGRARGLQVAFGIVLGVALTLAGVSVFAWMQRSAAIQQAAIALASQTSARSEVIRNQALLPTEIRDYQFAEGWEAWPDLVERSVLLAVEGARRLKSEEGHLSVEGVQALRGGLSLLPRLSLVLEHGEEVEKVFFSPDGRLLLTADSANTLRAWRGATQEVIARLPDAVAEVLWSRDGDFCVIATSYDLLVWSAKNGRTLWKKSGQTVWPAPLLSSNGKYVVSVSDDNARAVVWDAISGREVMHMDNLEEIGAVSLSPDGDLLAAAGKEEIRILRISTGKELVIPEYAEALAFSPDGKWLAEVTMYGFGIWDSESGKKIRSFLGLVPDEDSEDAEKAVFSSDGKRLSVAGEDNTVLLWDVDSGEEIWKVFYYLYDPVVSADGKHALIRQGAGIEVWDATEGKSEARILDRCGGKDRGAYAYDPWNRRVAVWKEKRVCVYAAASADEVAHVTHAGKNFHPVLNERWIASSGARTVSVWDADRARETAHLRHDEVVNVITFSPDQKHVATTSDDEILRIWEISSGRELARIEGIPTSVILPRRNDEEDDEEEDDDETVFVKSLSFSDSGKYLILIGRDDSARMWEVPSGREVARSNGISDLRLSPDEKYLLVARPLTTTVTLVSSGQEVVRVDHWGTQKAAFSPAGDRFATAALDETALVWETETGRKIARMVHQAEKVPLYSGWPGIEVVAFSPDGKYLITANERTARIWNIAEKRQVGLIRQTESVNGIRFSPDGRYLVTFSAVFSSQSASEEAGSTVHIWSLADEREVARFSHGNGVKGVAFSADGRYLATFSEDDSAQLYDLTQRRLLARLVHEDRVNSVELSPDNRYVATASSDKTARVWERSSGRELARVVHRGEVFRASFTEGGRLLATASMDGTARVSLWRPEDLIATACRGLTRNLTREEWSRYFGQATYRRTCRNLPEPKQ